MFEPVSQLGKELQQLAESSSGKGDLSQEVARFVSDVAHEADLAFSDVHETLREVAFLPESRFLQIAFSSSKSGYASTHARDKFKNALGICQRLRVLADNYEQRIAPRLGRNDLVLNQSCSGCWQSMKEDSSARFSPQDAKSTKFWTVINLAPRWCRRALVPGWLLRVSNPG